MSDQGIAPTGVTDVLVVRVMWVGIAAASVALLAGLAMLAARYEVICPDGTTFPANATDFRCFEHPQAMEGTAVTGLSIVLGIVVFLLAVLVRVTIAGEGRTDADGSRESRP